MKEMTRKTYVERTIEANGDWEGSFDPLQKIPIDRTDWFEHISERIKEEVNVEEYEENTTIAEATIDQVSYTNVDTGECDVRWEARYEIVV